MHCFKSCIWLWLLKMDGLHWIKCPPSLGLERIWFLTWIRLTTNLRNSSLSFQLKTKLKGKKIQEKRKHEHLSWELRLKFGPSYKFGYFNLKQQRFHVYSRDWIWFKLDHSIGKHDHWIEKKNAWCISILECRHFSSQDRPNLGSMTRL